MEQLKQMKEMLTGCVQGQLTHLDTVDAKELGEAVDMIKDLSEAIYYCTITKAMEEKEEKGSHHGNVMYYPVDYGMRYYDGMYPEWEYYRDMDKMKGRMYYGGNGTGHSAGGNSSVSSTSPSNGSGVRGYSEREMPFGEMMMRDIREGRSPKSRKTYMESKEMHKDKAAQLQELEKYAQELTADLVEMVEDASPEEKQFLSNRIAALATKIK